MLLVGETRVDLQHLLEDLRDAYSGSLEESIITEVVANALDAGATTISISVNPVAATLTIVDDGRGMQRPELGRYHDIAASSKRRGEGIGFAGVGLKLGLLMSREVLTETRRGRSHVATRWSLSSRHRAPWKWVPPPGLVAARGTAVRLTLTNPLSALLDAGFLEETLRRQFEPLFEPAFEAILQRHYGHPVAIDIEGRRLTRAPNAAEAIVPVSIRLARKRLPSATGYLARHRTPLPADRAGIAVSTFGKVIKRGWDWLGLAPAAAESITGLVEVPDLAECLTLNKNDFLRTGPRGATYLAYRKALQEVISRQLAAWGDERGDVPAPPRPSRLDRDLERVLEDLANEFPLLHSLVERRQGGQKRLPMPDGSRDDALHPLLSLTRRADATPDEDASAGAPGAASESPQPAPPPEDTSRPEPGDATEPRHAVETTLPGSSATRHRARYGLTLQFEDRPDDDEPGRLVDNTIWVNQRHPAFERASSSRSLGYHMALTVALALAPLAVTPSEEHLFVTRFLAEWGQAHAPRARRAARSKKHA